MTLILLRSTQKEISATKNIQIVSEIIDSSNEDLLASSQVTDVVIGPEIISMIITQLSQQQILKPIYDELLCHESNDICIIEKFRECHFERSEKSFSLIKWRGGSVYEEALLCMGISTFVRFLTSFGMAGAKSSGKR